MEIVTTRRTLRLRCIAKKDIKTTVRPRAAPRPTPCAYTEASAQA